MTMTRCLSKLNICEIMAGEFRENFVLFHRSNSVAKRSFIERTCVKLHSEVQPAERRNAGKNGLDEKF